MPHGGEIIRIRLQLKLCTLKFRRGAHGENRIVCLLSDRCGDQAEQEKKHDEPPAVPGGTMCFQRHDTVN